jgi:hypothetical protein
MSQFSGLGEPWLHPQSMDWCSWEKMVESAKERARLSNQPWLIFRNNHHPDRYFKDTAEVLKDDYLMERHTWVATVYPNGTVFMK